MAKAWLLALIARGPLSEVPRLPVEVLAGEAPGLAAALVDALADDTALDALGPGDDAGRIAGARDAAEAVAAVEALRVATWGSLRSALGADAPPEQLVAVAERLAHVASRLAEVAVGDRALDQLLEEADDFFASRRAPASPEGEPEQAIGSVPDDLADPGTSPWQAAVARRIVRHYADGQPFAAIVVELADADRWAVAAHEVVEAVDAALQAALRPGDQLVRERPGRAWIVAAQTDAADARALAGVVLDGARATAPHARLSAGVAVCPDDATDAEPLLAHAEAALYAALADGVGLR